MKRVQLFEFEDFHWFPSSIRTSMTNLIVVFLRMMGTKKVLANLLRQIKREHHFDQIVDMGSGSGSAMMMAVDELNENEEHGTKLLLTDLHPNEKLVKRINNMNNPLLSYQLESLDATNLRGTAEGLKTMINSFHHMTPSMARSILKTAVDNKQPLFIYELAENKIPVLLWALFLPISLPLLMIMVLFMTPFVKPLSWQQIVFTYIIPIIPICYAWDGQASLPRTYSFKDLEQMMNEIEGSNYEWRIDVAIKENGKSAGYYVFGKPTS